MQRRGGTINVGDEKDGELGIGGAGGVGPEAAEIFDDGAAAARRAQRRRVRAALRVRHHTTKRK